MNMPFEFGVDFGLRQSGLAKYGRKKFLIFEKSRFDLKSALSDIAGQDVDHHDDDFEVIIGKIRNFLKVEAEINAPGPQRIVSEYVTFQAWLMEKKIGEGHSEQQAIDLPTQERIQEMQVWINAGKPNPIINQ